MLSHETTYAPPGDENLPTMPIPTDKPLGNNLHPVRGRKRQLDRHVVIRLDETTYAPPGDENEVCYIDIVEKVLKQLTPRQGTKTLTDAVATALTYETTYAPSGDENTYGCSSYSSYIRNNLRPVRGRKKLLTHVDKEQKEVDTYETYFI